MKATARILGLRSDRELTPDTRVAYIVRLSPDPTPVRARELQQGIVSEHLCPAEPVKQLLTGETICFTALALVRQSSASYAEHRSWNRTVVTSVDQKNPALLGAGFSASPRLQG